MHENDGVRIAHRNRRDVPDAALYPQRPVNEILAGSTVTVSTFPPET